MLFSGLQSQHEFSVTVFVSNLPYDSSWHFSLQNLFYGRKYEWLSACAHSRILNLSFADGNIRFAFVRRHKNIKQ
jgi:hypothetical protein